MVSKKCNSLEYIITLPFISNIIIVLGVILLIASGSVGCVLIIKFGRFIFDVLKWTASKTSIVKYESYFLTGLTTLVIITFIVLYIFKFVCNVVKLFKEIKICQVMTYLPLTIEELNANNIKSILDLEAFMIDLFSVRKKINGSIDLPDEDVISQTIGLVLKNDSEINICVNKEDILDLTNILSDNFRWYLESGNEFFLREFERRVRNCQL